MKYVLIVLSLIPSLSFGSSYNCSGTNFSIDVSDGPAEMKIKGNGFDSAAQNVRMTSAFDTIVVGSTIKPAATVKLTIKDVGKGQRESFTGSFQVSSSLGIKNYKELNCTKGDN